MYSSQNIYYAYKKARKKFSLLTYGLLVVWLILAVAQWVMVCFIGPMWVIFFVHYYISIATFLLAILLFALFLFFEKVRFKKPVAAVFSILIVELQIIAVFTLVTRSYWTEMLMYFAICVVLIFICIGIGIALPRKLDLTLHVALLFILAFLFLLVAVFFLMFHLHVYYISPYAYILVQIPISITMLVFVMYHAQTIHGGRFAEMRLHDYFLGSLIIFHDFLIIFWLTFYWQISARLVTPTDWPVEGIISNPFTKTTDAAKFLNFGDDDVTYNANSNLYKEARGNVPFKGKTSCTTTELSITLDFVKDDINSRRLSSAPSDNFVQNVWVDEEKRTTAYISEDNIDDARRNMYIEAPIESGQNQVDSPENNEDVNLKSADETSTAHPHADPDYNYDE